MKCKIEHANRRKPSYDLDIYSLYDLKDLIKKENDAIIIDTDWEPDYDFHITVYDDYIE